MQLPYLHELDWLIYQDKPIPIEYIHWYWRFARCPDWDSQEDKRNVKSDTHSPSQSFSTSNQTSLSLGNFSLPGNSSLPGNPLSFGIPSSPGVLPSPINPTSAGNSPLLGNPTSLGNCSFFVHLPSPANLLFPLDLRLQRIEEPLAVTPCGRLSGSLNKKRSRKDDNFEQSTRRKPS